MNRTLSVSIAQLGHHVLHVEAGRPWYSNFLVTSAICGLIVGGSAGFAIFLVSFLPGWEPVSLASTPTFCIASLLCTTVMAVKTWTR